MVQREVLNAFVDGNQLVQLFRKEDGRVYALRKPAEYVSYLETKEVPVALGRELRGSSYTTGMRAEGRWCRVNWLNDRVRDAMGSHPESPVVKAGITVYEGDVDPVRRNFAENDAVIATPRRCYVDIETDSRVPFSEKEKMRVLSWAVVCHDTGRQWSGVLEEWSDASERALLEGLWAALDPFDQVVAWYGDGFDFPVIFARSAHHKLKTDARRWLYLDHLEAFKKFNMHSAESGEEKRSMQLEDIGQSITGRGKLQTPEWVRERFGDKSMGALSYELWEAGGEFRKLLGDYNVQDTTLLRDIEMETGYLELFNTVCEVCGLFPSTESLNPTHQMDGFMLRLGRQRGYHFPTKRFRENVVKFKGAFVMQPTVLDPVWRAKHNMEDGIARNVHVCDFSAMYPSIILTWNMSPDTKASDGTVNGPIPTGMCRAPMTGVCFRTDVEGILPAALREMIRLRKFWNDKKASLPPVTPEWHDADRRSTAYKVVANSFYGVMGSPFSRYFDRYIAESVTQAGVWLLRRTMAEAEAKGFVGIYGDTDSAFIMRADRKDFAAFVEWCNTDLYPRLLKEQGCQGNEIKLAYEKEFDRIVFTSAKRYCNPPEAPIWMGDMSFKPLGEVKVGDEVVGWLDGEWVSKTKKRVLSYVVAVHRHKAPILKLTMASGQVIRCTADHRWLHMHRSVRANGCQFVTPKVGRTLAHVIDVPRKLTAAEALCASWRAIIGHRFAEGDRVEKVEEDGEGEVIGLTTTTGNYVAWGYASKNCGSYRHYKWSTTCMCNVKDKKGGVRPGALNVQTMTCRDCGTVHEVLPPVRSEPEIKGLEYKRGDVLRMAAELQAYTMDLLVGGLHIANDAAVPTTDLERYHAKLSRVRQRILQEPLSIDDVRLSKGLSKPLREYAVKPKQDGTPAAQPPHVTVAHILKSRGQDVREGTRIDFFIQDGSTSPQLALPAEDFKGECDRYHLWESLVYPATQRLLEAAFPGHDWAGWAKVRPPNVRKSAKGSTEQTPLFAIAQARHKDPHAEAK